jgi:[histone H3]-lysine36 N-dimethyltransferase SETMAR
MRQRHDKIILLHDNARPYVAKLVKEILEALGWDVLPHLPFSDVAPSNYHLFWLMQHGISEQHFNVFEDIKKWFDG